MDNPRERFVLNLSKKLVADGLDSELAHKVAEGVAAEYVGQPIQPLVDYYKGKHLKVNQRKDI